MPALDARWFYGDYLLSCTPHRRDDGRYEARVIVIMASPQQSPSQRFLDLNIFESEEAAIEHARRAGMEWVDARARSF